MAKKIKLDERDYFNEKKLNTIMKRFLNTKKTDPEETKFYYVENGVNFYATSLGASVEIAFTNKFENSYNKGTGENFFVQPAKEPVVKDYLEEMVEVGKGKKKEWLPTGHKIQYPDVKGLFKRFNPKLFKRILIEPNMIDELVTLHETITTINKLGGMYKGAKLYAIGNKLVFGVDDVAKLNKFEYTIDFVGDRFEQPSAVFHYNPDFMIAVLKTIKDLKTNKTIMYLNDTDPILFYGKDVEYIYKMAFSRKLVKE